MCVPLRYVLGLVLLAGACDPVATSTVCEPGQVCAGATEASCATGPSATLYGRATLGGGTCIATSDASCAASSVTCRVFGQCHAPTVSPRTATCPTSDVDFFASRNATCSPGTCVATDEDCRQARVCKLEGRCVAKDGVCVADAAACRASDRCVEAGRCVAAGVSCQAGSRADCLGSAGCRERGDCGFSEGACMACAASQDCKDEGLCQRVECSCRATASEHCQGSLACRRDGRCRAFQGQCVK